MSLQRESNTQKVAEFPVPYRGTWRGVAANQLSPDTLFDSMNVFIREGKIRTRPGLRLFRSTVFNQDVIGGGLAVLPAFKKMLAFTPTELYTNIQNQNEWIVESVGEFSANVHKPIDVAFTQAEGIYLAVVANEDYVLKYWNGTLGSVQEITPSVGSVPRACSVCIAARRVVALVPPHTLRWTSTLTYTNWNALNTNSVASTTDVGICVRSLSKNSFALYKERSIHLARAQAGSDAQAFSFAEPIVIEGPAGIHSVVQANDAHFYMTASGRIARFDGSTFPQWIADGLWFYLQNLIDPEYTNKIMGFFDYRLHCVIFFYPTIGDLGRLYNFVLINLPLDGSGVEGFSCFLGQMMKPISFGYEMRFRAEASRSVVFSATVDDKQSFLLDENEEQDDGITYQCMMQTPLQPMQDLRHNMMTSEVFLERGTGYGYVDLYGVRSNALENPTGFYEDDKHRINLEFNPFEEYTGFGITTARFFGLRLQWPSTSNVKYAGSVVYGRPQT